ncbi:MAG: RluA family pseudouridine synthase [Firmicutes bacterium]|nr:RluA family pseudouridine synthase [Bacillota bacterium]
MINILYEDNHLLVVEKKPNIPVQLDDSNDEDLLSILKKYLKEKYQKPGNVYLGLVHRLDRPVGGVMVFAKTCKASSRLSKQIRNQVFEKEYFAVLEGNIVQEKGILKDKLLKNSKTNTTKVDKNGKEAVLEYELVSSKNNLSLVKVNLITGRSHQIRVQFSSRGYPLYGDQRYNKNAKKVQIALYATKLAFYHPITNEKLTFEIKIPNRYPFTIFK